MLRATIVGGAIVIVLVLIAVATRHWLARREVLPAFVPAVVAPPPVPHQTAAAAPNNSSHQGFLYGRVTTQDGITYEGRLRFGRDAEAFWGDLFTGVKKQNPWTRYVAAERLPRHRRSFGILGFELFHRDEPFAPARPFTVPFGEIVRIEARGRQLHVTLKSGTVVTLDRFETSDFDDGVRVWDAQRGTVDLDSLRIRTIELLPTGRVGAVPDRLQGTVRSRQGDFTGFVQWDRYQCTGTDVLFGHSAGGDLRLRFAAIRSIARRSRLSALVTLRDGRAIVLSGTPDVDFEGRGVFITDPRFGRVGVPWGSFERIDFRPGDSGPGFGDFAPGRALAGSVTTRNGRRLAGRLVYDLDESETTDTLDAPSGGVDYTIPFALVASIALPRAGEEDRRATATLHDGSALHLERSGDLGDANGGILVFVHGRPRPEYVPWGDVEQVDLASPPAARVPER